MRLGEALAAGQPTHRIDTSSPVPRGTRGVNHSGKLQLSASCSAVVQAADWQRRLFTVQARSWCALAISVSPGFRSFLASPLSCHWSLPPSLAFKPASLTTPQARELGTEKRCTLSKNKSVIHAHRILLRPLTRYLIPFPFLTTSPPLHSLSHIHLQLLLASTSRLPSTFAASRLLALVTISDVPKIPTRSGAQC